MEGKSHPGDSMKVASLFKKSFRFFGCSRRSVVLYVSFGCAAYFMQDFPSVRLVPTWQYTQLLHHYCVCSLCCAVCPCGCFVTANLRFSLPSPFSPSPLPPHLSAFCLQDSCVGGGPCGRLGLIFCLWVFMCSQNQSRRLLPPGEHHDGHVHHPRAEGAPLFRNCHHQDCA